MIDCDLSSGEFTRIIAFLGYGPVSAPVWFIGMEEGLGGMSTGDCCENLKARATFERTMDLREAHLRLVERGVPIDIERNTPSTQVWQYMAKIMLAWGGDQGWRNRDTYKNYVRYSLGRKSSDSFLSEISPIPSQRAAGKEWREFFLQNDPGLDARLMLRSDDLREQLRIQNPSLVICYGLRRREQFAEMLGGIEWEPVCERYSRPMTGHGC